MAHESASIAHPEPIDRIAAARRGAGSHANAATAARHRRRTASLGFFPRDTGPPGALLHEQFSRASTPCRGTLDRFGHPAAAASLGRRANRIYSFLGMDLAGGITG